MPLTVVVLDGGGHVVSMDREDGSGLLRPAIAVGKAYGALGLGIGSRTVAARNQGRDAFLGALAAASEGRFVPVPGGALILEQGGKSIGAVGVSGDTSDEDEACAVAGIEAAGLRAGIDTTNS
jgi:glc operon protein GlcG